MAGTKNILGASQAWVGPNGWRPWVNRRFPFGRGYGTVSSNLVAASVLEGRRGQQGPRWVATEHGVRDPQTLGPRQGMLEPDEKSKLRSGPRSATWAPNQPSALT